MMGIRKTILLLFLVAGSAWAGGGPQNVLVVVNDQDQASLEAGQYYQDMRHVPERNVFHINTPSNSSMSAATFSNVVRNPLLNYIATSGLSNQIDYIVFCGRAPYMVAGKNGMSSCLFYDYKGITPECDLPTNTFNAYYEYERAFEHEGAPSSNRYYISTLLAAYTLDETRQLVDRSVLADHTRPTSTVYYVRPFPNPRNVRWTQYRDADYSARFLDIPQTRSIYDGFGITDRTNTMGVAFGAEAVAPTRAHILPGAIGDHLTSFGGCLENTCGQTNILEWIRGGAVGSYGTAIEPCAYTQKFPHVRSHFWYARGFNMGESYMMSIRDPYKGVLIGDPLCSPYATPPIVSLGGLTSGAVVSNSVSIVITGLSVEACSTVSRVDLFMDGLYVATVTNVTPNTSNEVRVTIMETNCTYVVASGDTLYDVAGSLAAAINSSNVGVTAYARGDRIELVQDARGVAATGITYGVHVTNLASPDLTLDAWTAGTNFAETIRAAYQRITLQGVATPGDVVTMTVTRIDGEVFTNTVVAGVGDGTTNLMTNLAYVINSDTNLQVASGCYVKYLKGLGTDDGLVEAYVFSRSNHWSGYNVNLSYSESGLLLTGSYSGKLTSGNDFVSGRGMLFLGEGQTSLVATYEMDTTMLADGPHELHAVAYAGTALRTQGHALIPFDVRNHDMTCVVTAPGMAASFEWGASVTTAVEASASPGTVTQVLLYVEGKLYGQTNMAPYTFVWHTTNYGAGVIGVQAEARSSDGDTVVSAIRHVRVFRDLDADGAPDWWEYLHFGSATNAAGHDDEDGDGVTNADEFAADTDPNDSNAFFRVQIDAEWSNGLARLTFPSSTSRLYEVNYNDHALTNNSAWLAGVTDLFWGVEGNTEWEDDGTNAPPATNAVRYYRIGVHVP